MKTSDIALLAIGNLRRQPRRTVLTVLGVVIGTASIILMVSLGIAINMATDDMLQRWGDLTSVTVYNSPTKPHTLALDDSMAETFSALPGVVVVTPQSTLGNWQSTIQTGRRGQYTASGYIITGMVPASLAPLGYNTVTGQPLQLTPSRGNTISVVASQLAAFEFSDSFLRPDNPNAHRVPYDSLGNPDIDNAFFPIDKAGLTLSIVYGYDASNSPLVKEYTLEIVGVYKQEPDDYALHRGIIMSHEDLQRINSEVQRLQKRHDTSSQAQSGGSNAYDMLIIKVADLAMVEAVEAEVRQIGFETYSLAEQRNEMQAQVASNQAALGGLAAISLLVAAINITSIMTMVVNTRTREIGNLKVLGCRPRHIRRMILVEAGFIGLLGGIIGCAVSLVLGFVMNNLNSWVTELGLEYALDAGGLFGGMSLDGEAAAVSIIPPWLLLYTLLFSFLIGLLAGYFPSKRALEISCVDALRQ